MNRESSVIIVIASIISISGFLTNLLKRAGTDQIVQDNNSIIWFRLGVMVSVILSIVIYFFGWGKVKFPESFILCGYALIISGLCIRWIAIISLGNAFTVKIATQKNQKLKTNGLYKMIRHPSYTGLLMYYLGFGLIMHNLICLFILILFPLTVVLNRIRYEEPVLVNHFGTEYEAYRQRTRKLIPWIY